MQEGEREIPRTNAEDLSEENPVAVPYSTGSGEPEPEFVGQQPNRFPPPAESNMQPEPERDLNTRRRHR